MKVLVLLLLLAGQVFATEPVIDCVEVKTRAKENALVKVWYRVPRNYDANGRGLSRVLILFGGRNCDGKPEVSGKLGWTEWADLNGIFLVAPTLKNDNYWEPEKWSGRAMQDALAQIASKYRIATSGLLYYGYSAGSQASNLFPAWRPDLCRAYVSHACGVFHTPTGRMRNVPGLVTCGDADTARYVISRQFVEKYRSLGISVIWKSFPNHPHDVPPDSIRLAKEFLAHHHWTHPEDLGGEALGFVSCGTEDTDRLRISRDFVYRAREVGGLILWKPVKSGHGLNDLSLSLARAFFSAVSRGTPCTLWGEDDTRRVCEADQIEVEFRNPLYDSQISSLWRQ